MNKKRSLIVALPLLIILAGLAFYEYVYLQIKAEVASVMATQAAKANSLQKYLTFVSKKPELEKRLVQLRETTKADEPKLLSGDTLSLAAASLQTTVKGMITSRGGTISSERVEKPEDLGKFKVVSVSIDAVVPDPRALSDALYAMETQTPYLAVRELDARVKNFTQPRELMIRLKVSGITRGK
jgi:Type II secretion system (T2SS), protein M subtype b